MNASFTRLCSITFAALIVTVTALTQAHAARLALVIGNDQYEQHSKLRKAGNDADAMAGLLKRSGFTVVNENLRRDLSRSQMNQVFSQLVQRVRRDDEVVVFFSGHGLQYGDSSVITGKDFPKPFDRTLALSEGIQLKGWQETIRRAGARFALFVIDACREDITADGLVKSMSGEDSLFRAMEPTNPPEGQMVIFSARSGQLALDRVSNADTNPNGVFTRVFLEEAQKPGVSILDVVGETEERVAQLAATVQDRQTGQPHRQKPALRNEAGQRVRFCFVSRNGQCGDGGTAPPPRPNMDAEEEAFKAAQAVKAVAAYEAYLREYPQGRYAGAARVAIAGLTPAQQPQPQPQPPERRVGEVFRDCPECPELVVIPGGSFTMGSNDYDNEKPPHGVNIKSFALGKTEVTQGQWKAVMGSNPSKFRDCGDACPVEMVSWEDAQEYIKRLNAKTSKQYRLSSESEWEYAARGGTETKYAWGDAIGKNNANCDGCGSRWDDKTTAPVASFSANRYGLHDMHGNVREWVEDCWRDNYSGAPIDGSAWTSNCKATSRVLRGGSWGVDPVNLRSADRVGFAPGNRNSGVGFRIARTF